MWSDRELAAVLVAQGSVPGLRVIVAPHCHGRAWLVDSCCEIVYLSGQLAGLLRTDALFEALAELVATARRDRSSTVPGVPEQRGQMTLPGFAERG